MLSGNITKMSTILAHLAANGLSGEGRVSLTRLRLGMNYFTGSVSALWEKFFETPSYFQRVFSRSVFSKTLDGQGIMCAGFCLRSASVGPQSCFKGTYRQRKDAKTLGECLECTAGHYCDWRDFSAGLGSPKPCAEGTYRSEEGADDRSQCESVSVFPHAAD